MVGVGTREASGVERVFFLEFNCICIVVIYDKIFLSFCFEIFLTFNFLNNLNLLIII